MKAKVICGVYIMNLDSRMAVVRDFNRMDLNTIKKALSFLKRFNRIPDMSYSFCFVNHDTNPSLVRLMYRDCFQYSSLAGYYAGQLSLKLSSHKEMKQKKDVYRCSFSECEASYLMNE